MCQDYIESIFAFWTRVGERFDTLSYMCVGHEVPIIRLAESEARDSSQCQ